ncbi:MAG: hypothetical protein HYV09_18525 [Deltaproteobacteria bacterium]|nr:hypothetical protein [Deltaproteobacteria bacterium]
MSARSAAVLLCIVPLLGCGAGCAAPPPPADSPDVSNDAGAAPPSARPPLGEDDDGESPPVGGVITYATRLQRANAVAIDDRWVYWTVQGRGGPDGFLMRAPKAGGAVETLADRLRYPNEVLVDDEAIYWVEFLANRLWRLAKSGGPPIVRVSSPHTFYGAAMDATHIYWADNGSLGSAIWRVSKSGGEPERVAALEGSVGRPVLDGSRVYFHLGVSSEVNNIVSLPKSGGTATTVVEKAFPPIGVDDTSVYLLLGATGPGVVTKWPKAGGATSPEILASDDIPWGSIALDDRHVYWGTYTALLAVSKTGGEKRVLMSGQESVSAVAVDATRIYWTEYGVESAPTGAVHSIPK